ncbi:hypothetical protein N8I84_41900 (plasmid) [Streptomyces cynarae]|uniref:Uncharacterized protein n=1 Tax=Streptomyces cynarae TaxID=2981134 RepID=A0ABY6EJM3_9ACTN|nr:hypothetical protein [Streptomyces cynarae]UXY24988.1 hypothetical protein N8I84_41900 [Streptomyces cynarae]
MPASLHPHHATRQAPPTDTSRPASDRSNLSLEARLAAVDAAMSVRLDEAAVAYEVRTAHIPTEPVDVADVVTVPLPLTPTLTPSAPQTYSTPVAALLERAHRRMEADGWCAGALVDDDGAVCLLGAIRAEAAGDRGLEADAARVVLEAIHRRFGDDIESVPAFNDAFGSGRTPLRMLDEAASLADAKGL